MTQLSLTTPIARSSDPTSSHAAAAAITRDGTRGEQAAQVLAALLRHPGMTSRELAHLAGLDRYVVARRLPELAQATPPRARKGEGADARYCQRSGRLACTWWAL